MNQETRATLHKSRLEEFKKWLTADGWILRPAQEYKVINAKKGDEHFFAYERIHGDHLTVQQSIMHVVAKFLMEIR